MSDPLSTAAALVGIIVPALHGIKLLVEDVSKVRDAPETVKGLKRDLQSLSSSLEVLKAIGETQWKMLGTQVSQLSKETVSDCTAACGAFQKDLKRWTIRSREGKMSWRDRNNIGFFKEHRVKAMSKQLQSWKRSLGSVVGTRSYHNLDLILRIVRRRRQQHYQSSSDANRTNGIFSM
ncbi:hypothetical protein LTR17_009824 [Elasticomyces elasticus]|nr:hypothetical protein LTR17_009824 [Elasticomyces elasticus]